MRRVAISAACAVVIWIVALMSTDVSANQPQVSYDFSGSSFSGAAPVACASPLNRLEAFPSGE